MVSSVKCPKELPKICDGDWAASDKPVLACTDGCVRIMDMEFKTGSSPMEEHQLTGCYHMLDACVCGIYQL